MCRPGTASAAAAVAFRRPGRRLPVIVVPDFRSQAIVIYRRSENHCPALHVSDVDPSGRTGREEARPCPMIETPSNTS